MPQENSEGQDRESEDYGFIIQDGDELYLKYCYKCGEDLPISEFCGDVSERDGMNRMCRECSKKYKKKWYKDNREYALKECKQYKKDNRERIKQYFYQYHIENRESIIQRVKQWRKNNPERRKEHDRRYRLKNKDKILEKQRQYRLRKKMEKINEVG